MFLYCCFCLILEDSLINDMYFVNKILEYDKRGFYVRDFYISIFNCLNHAVKFYVWIWRLYFSLRIVIPSGVGYSSNRWIVCLLNQKFWLNLVLWLTLTTLLKILLVGNVRWYPVCCECHFVVYSWLVVDSTAKSGAGDASQSPPLRSTVIDN